jgi:hypothetical protein
MIFSMIDRWPQEFGKKLSIPHRALYCISVALFQQCYGSECIEIHLSPLMCTVGRDK